MKNKTIMKIVSICFIFVLIFNMTGSIYAAVNTNYGENTEVVEPDLEAKMQNSALLEAIASLVYGVGSLVESLVGTAFEMLTGSNMFPWADKVIFNTIPFLDVNFLNPAEGSLFLKSSGEETVLAGIVRNMYFSVLVLAIGFLGIVVGLMAVRLAVSTIAAEKAKYKQAITNFLVSLIMLFCVHYAISLIFYINESLVEIASQILMDSTKDATIQSEFFASELTDEQLVKNFFDSQEMSKKWDDFKEETLSDGTKVGGNDENIAIMSYLLRNSDYKKYAIPDAFGNGETEKGILDRAGKYIAHIFNVNEDELPENRIKADLERAKAVAAADAKYKDSGKEVDKHELRKRLDQYNQEGAEYYNDHLGKEEFEKFCTEQGPTYRVKYADRENSGIIDDTVMKWWNEDGIVQAEKDYNRDILANNMKVIQVIVNSSNASTRYANTNSTTIISQMGQYFKENAWTYETDEDGNFEGWDNSELTLQGALLYAIFVFQSVLFFVAYIKRFFFVVILAILAPVIVIYDFLGKAIM